VPPGKRNPEAALIQRIEVDDLSGVLDGRPGVSAMGPKMSNDSGGIACLGDIVRHI
jgi:hypothetical protein